MFVNSVRMSPTFGSYESCLKEDPINLVRKVNQGRENLEDAEKAIKKRLENPKLGNTEKGLLESAKKLLGIED